MAGPGAKFCTSIAWRNESGITLVEILAALSIMVILLSVLSQVLYTGSRMWTKNDAAYQKQRQLQNVYTVLAQDLTSAYASALLPGTFALKGDDGSVCFWRETATGLQQVAYRYDSVRKTLFRQRGFWGEKAEEKVIFQGIAQLRFEYYEAESRNWQYNWEPQFKTSLPSLIKVTVATTQSDLGPLVIPLEAWHGEAER